MRLLAPALALLLVAAPPALAQDSVRFTRADTLRGAPDSPGRSWWDVTFYDLRVAIDPADSSIRGSNAITYRVQPTPSPGPRELQIDLMVPLEVDSIVQDGRSLPFRRDGNAFFVTPADSQPAGAAKTVTVYYQGRPQIAKRPPWEGGFTWGADSLGRPWVVTTDQGMGASVWWPNKDTQADEPDSQRVAITVPNPLTDVSTGRLRSVTPTADGTTTWEWFVSSPIARLAATTASLAFSASSRLVVPSSRAISSARDSA